jgi:hypothetical protein
MYLRFEREKPRISGNAALRSSAILLKTPAPQLLADCRSSMMRPISQYNVTSSMFTCRRA